MEISAGRVVWLDDIDYIITWNDNVEQLPYYYTGRRGVCVSTNAREVREPCKQGDFYQHCRALFIYRCDILPFFRVLFALFNRFCQNGPGPERTVFFWTLSIQTCFATIPANLKEKTVTPRTTNFLFPPDGPFTSWTADSPNCGVPRIFRFPGPLPGVLGRCVCLLSSRSGQGVNLASCPLEKLIFKSVSAWGIWILIGICPLSKLHAVSAIGIKLCFYTAEAGHITPPRIVADDQLTIDTPSTLLHWGVGTVMWWSVSP